MDRFAAGAVADEVVVEGLADRAFVDDDFGDDGFVDDFGDDDFGDAALAGRVDDFFDFDVGPPDRPDALAPVAAFAVELVVTRDRDDVDVARDPPAADVARLGRAAAATARSAAARERCSGGETGRTMDPLDVRPERLGPLVLLVLLVRLEVAASDERRAPSRRPLVARRVLICPPTTSWSAW